MIQTNQDRVQQAPELHFKSALNLSDRVSNVKVILKSSRI